MNEQTYVPNKFFLFSRTIVFDLILFFAGIYIAFVNDLGLPSTIGVGKHAIWIIGAWNIYRRLKTWQAIGREGKAWYRSKTIRDNVAFVVLAILNLWYAWEHDKSVVMPVISMWSAAMNIWLRLAYTKTRVYPFNGE